MKIGTSASKQKTLDTWFSKYIRLKNATDQGVCICITCSRPFLWNDIDCGHFVPRNHKIVRYDERNCAPQCKSCNRFSNGEQWKFGQAIDKIHGEGTAELLQGLSKRSYKREPSDFNYLIDEYKIKAKQEAKRLGIKL